MYERRIGRERVNISITARRYISKKQFDDQSFKHRDARLMDKGVKIAVQMARQLYEKVNKNTISPEELGVVLGCDTGPLAEIVEYNTILKEKGYVGINPSKFPNIMSATALSRVSTEINAKGPCVPLLFTKDHKHALLYANEQISAGRCRAMMIIHLTKDGNCFGFFIEKEE